MDLVLFLARLLLVVTFAWSGVAKLADRVGARRAMRDFGIPARLTRPAAVLLSAVELVVAAALVPVPTAWPAALAALGLLVLFTAVLGYHLARGHAVSCHCFGQASAEPAGWPAVVRNVLLIAVAGTVVVAGREHAGLDALGWASAAPVAQRVEPALGALAVALLAGGGVALFRQGRRVLARLDDLEATLAASPAPYGGNGARDGSFVPSPRTAPEVEETAVPFAGNVPAAGFALPDLQGGTVTLDGLLAEGKPVVLLFADPGCGPCEALLPEVGRWRERYAGELTLAVISRGAPAANRRAAALGVRPLLQKDREVAEAYGVEGTPCAVVIGRDGTVRTSAACGERRIRALVARTAAAHRRYPHQGESAPPRPGPPDGHHAPGGTADRTGSSTGAATAAGVTADSASSYAAEPAGGDEPMVAGGCGESGGREESVEADGCGEPVEADGHEVTAPDGLVVGAVAPGFRLDGPGGEAFGTGELRGMRSLLLFWDPACGFCERMLPDLRAWEAEPGGVALVVISTGTVEENRALGLVAPVLTDEGFTVGPLFGAHGTPAGVLVDEDGRIASEMAVGAPAVLALARGPAGVDPAAGGGL